jgi:hypothetical protein
MPSCLLCLFAAMCLQMAPSYLEAARAVDDEDEREGEGMAEVLVAAAERLALVVCDKFQHFDSEEMTRCV